MWEKVIPEEAKHAEKRPGIRAKEDNQQGQPIRTGPVGGPWIEQPAPIDEPVSINEPISIDEPLTVADADDSGDAGEDDPFAVFQKMAKLRIGAEAALSAKDEAEAKLEAAEQAAADALEEVAKIKMAVSYTHLTLPTICSV